jgi:hypothetical protein
VGTAPPPMNEIQKLVTALFQKVKDNKSKF